MSVSTPYIVRAIIDSIEAEVLPHLEAQARPASHLRACLMMLANVETRIEHEAKNLFDDNRELRELLGAADELLSGSGLSKLIDAYPERSYFDVAAASEENRNYHEALTQVIKQLGANPDAAGKASADFKTKLHRYLANLAERDHRLVETGLKHVPL